MADADWFEALSPEAQKIAFVIEYSIAKSGRAPLDSKSVQARYFYISYLSQGVLCETEEEIMVVAGPYWGIRHNHDSLLPAGEILLPAEMAETIVSNRHPDEATKVTRVVVGARADWARGVLGPERLRTKYDLVESIIEVMDYYELSGRPDYYYPHALLLECLKRHPAWRVLDIYDKYQSNEVVSREAVDALRDCFEGRSVESLFYYHNRYKEINPAIAEMALESLEKKCYSNDKGAIVLILLRLVLKGEADLSDWSDRSEQYALRA